MGLAMGLLRNIDSTYTSGATPTFFAFYYFLNAIFKNKYENYHQDNINP